MKIKEKKDGSVGTLSWRRCVKSSGLVHESEVPPDCLCR